MKRLFWLGLGVAVGVVVTHQVAKAIQSYSPSGLAGQARNSAAGVLGSVRDFIADVREGMAEREAEIHAALERGISLADLDELRHDSDAFQYDSDAFQNDSDAFQNDSDALQHNIDEEGSGFRR